MKSARRKLLQKGFTLIELLVVIAIIAILAVTVFVALDPATRFADSRNSRRWVDVTNVLTAVHECIVDQGGSLTQCGITDTAAHDLGSGDFGLNSTMSAYIKAWPQDPSNGGASDTRYNLQADSNNMITISAEEAENSETIEVSR